MLHRRPCQKTVGTQIYAGRKIGVASHVRGFVADNVFSFTLWAKSLGAKPEEVVEIGY
jgi:hypothetical protein